MLSYSQSLSLYQKLTSDADSANTIFFNIIFNEKIRHLLSKRDWPFLEETKSINTIASTQLYNLPANFKKLLNIYVQIGDQKYIPEQVPTRIFWDKITASQSVESNIPQRYTIIGKQIGLYPASSDTSGVIHYRYKVRQKDLTVVDYTTGTITSISNGGTTVVGNGTTWTDKMAGRWIRITDSDADNTGDGEWYEIDSVTSNTELELVSPYNGVSVSVATASYNIGQISEIPEDYQIIPVYESVADYWAKEKDFNTSTYFQNLANVKKDEMIEEFYSLSEDPIVQEDVAPIINPNLTIRA